MHIYLIRHTEYENPKNLYHFHLPLKLSKKGREHASKIADWLLSKNHKKIAIYSSPIVRCIETSEILSTKLKTDVIIDDRLIEVTCENLEGTVKPDELSWKLEEDDKSRESKKSVLKRMISIYKELIKKSNDCVMVTHGEPSTVLYYYLQKKPLPKYLWSPENKENVLHKGMIIDIKVEEERLKKITKIQV